MQITYCIAILITSGKYCNFHYNTAKYISNFYGRNATVTLLKAPSYEQNLKNECITFIAIFGKQETMPRVFSSCMWQQYNNGPPEKRGV